MNCIVREKTVFGAGMVETSDRPKAELTEDRRFSRRSRQPNLRNLPKVSDPTEGFGPYRKYFSVDLCLTKMLNSTLKYNYWSVQQMSAGYVALKWDEMKSKYISKFLLNILGFCGISLVPEKVTSNLSFT